jgi:hypothetical protein
LARWCLLVGHWSSFLFLLSPSNWMVFMLLSLARWCLLVGHLFCFDFFFVPPFPLSNGCFSCYWVWQGPVSWLDISLMKKHGKICIRGILDFFVENIHKLNFNTLNSWTFFILMINKRNLKTSLNKIKRLHVLICI